MKKIVLLVPLFLLTLGTAGCTKKEAAQTPSPQPEVTLHYSAAASLKDALGEIEKNYEKANPSIHLDIDYGGSGAIREKVVAGAPIDGVLLASKADTDKLIEAGKLEAENKLLENTLVIVKNKQDDRKKADLATIVADAKKIAIGNPETVPAGQYAKQSLKKAVLYNAVKEHLVMASDVRQVLAYVEAGNAEVGFVYKTDALTSDKVTVLADVENDLHEDILYYTGVVKDSKNKAAVTKFNTYLGKSESQTVLEKYGFTMAQ